MSGVEQARTTLWPTDRAPLADILDRPKTATARCSVANQFPWLPHQYFLSPSEAQHANCSAQHPGGRAKHAALAQTNIFRQSGPTANSIWRVRSGESPPRHWLVIALRHILVLSPTYSRVECHLVALADGPDFYQSAHPPDR